jgi:aldose sugar dehydrogenase
MTLFKMFRPLIGLFLFITFIWILVSIGYNGSYYSVHAYGGNKGYGQLPIIHNDPSLKTELVFIGLDHPTSMAFLGADDILVLEKNNGTVQRIVNGSMLDEPVLDVSVANKRTRGILGIDVASNSIRDKIYVFLYYTESSRGIDGNDRCPGHVCNHAQEPLGNRLYRYELRGDKLVSSKLLLDLPATPGSGQNGGPIRVGPDKNVYLVIGDLLDPRTIMSNNSTGLPPDGTSGVLRITQDGQPIIAGNILGDADPLNKYYAYGIRNSFGIDFDPLTGNLWDTENGPNYGDEINLVEPGFNSGSSVVQGIWYSNPSNLSIPGDVAPLKPHGLVDFDGKGKYSKPEFTWHGTVSPTAIAFINSDKLGKKYSNDILVGDINYGNIYHFSLNENRTGLSLEGALVDNVADTYAENEDIMFGSGFRGITDMQVGPDGYLYILSYYDGAIYRIVPIHSIIPKQSIINLLDNNQIWKPFNQATLSQNDGTLTINVDSNKTKKIFNRSFLPTKINYLMNKTLLLNLDYVSKSDMGNATFFAQIIENSSSYNTNGTKKILWSSLLHNTSGKLTSETFILPDVANKAVEFRFYVITEGKGEHTLTIKKANIVHL